MEQSCPESYQPIQHNNETLKWRASCLHSWLATLAYHCLARITVLKVNPCATIGTYPWIRLSQIHQCAARASRQSCSGTCNVQKDWQVSTSGRPFLLLVQPCPPALCCLEFRRGNMCEKVECLQVFFLRLQTSALSPSWTWAITSPVAGLTVAKVLPLADFTNSPLMNSLVWSFGVALMFLVCYDGLWPLGQPLVNLFNSAWGGQT